MSARQALTMAAVTGASIFIVNNLASREGIFRQVFRA
jgi:hypothetical protein